MIHGHPRLAAACIGLCIMLTFGTMTFVFGTTPNAVAADPVVSVQPTAETDPVRHPNDAADDPSIWINPTDPALSTIIATDKQGGLEVYDLSGKEIQYLPIGRVNNVDLRYNFPLGGERVALVVASNQSTMGISTYRINPATRQLEDVAIGTIKAGMQVYGTCMYHSPKTGKYYTFMTRNPYPQDDPKANNGEVRQYELFDNGGKVDARFVRSFIVGSDSEGCVADDELGQFYIAQTKVGIWQYGAEPDDGSARVSVAAVGDAHLQGELEGMSIYYTSRKTGYIVVSQQCCSNYAVYKREGNHDYVVSFKVVANTAAGIDRVTGTDGLDLTNFALGSAFPQGLMVIHDTVNNDIAGQTASTNSNFKLIPWQGLANAANPQLTIDTSWDPRAVGAVPTPVGAPTATATATATATSPVATATAPVLPVPSETPDPTLPPDGTPDPLPSPTEVPTGTSLNQTYIVWLPVVSQAESR